MEGIPRGNLAQPLHKAEQSQGSNQVIQGSVQMVLKTSKDGDCTGSLATCFSD